MSNIILSAFSDEYASGFEEQLIGMNKLGVKNIEIRFIDGQNVSEITTEQAKFIKEKLKEYNVSVSAIGSPIGKIKLSDDFSEHLKLAENCFKIADSLGVQYVRIFSFYANENEDIHIFKDDVLNRLGRLLDLADRYNLTLCHENESKIYGDTPQKCLELLNHFDGRLKCVFDMGNFVLENVNPYSEAYNMLKKYIAYFHIKDALFEGTIVPAGKGEAKIAEILKEHKSVAKNDFFVSLEPHLQTFSGLNALVGRSFENPYKYKDQKSAFEDGLKKFREILNNENL